MTLHEVSKRAGVSIATVSRVVNGSPLVKPATRERVEEVIRELNYAPSFAARMLARDTTDTLGVVFPDLDSGFFVEVLQGIYQEAARQGFDLMIAFGHHPEDEMRLIRQYVMERRVDALIIMNLHLDESFLQTVQGVRTPLVLLDRPYPHPGSFSLSIDNMLGASTMMKHLADDHGYRRIAVLTGPSGTWDADQRLEACRQTAAEAGISLPDELIWPGQFSEVSGYQAVDAFLGRGTALPDAVFALNDQMAVGALQRFREAGIDVPGQVALAGFDDTALARHLGLSTVHIPLQEIGQQAVEAAIAHINHPDRSHVEILVPTDIVLRASCGCQIPSQP